LTSLAIVPVNTLGSPNIGMRAAILLGAALAIAPTPVLAEMHVRGSPEAVRIDARDTSVEEVLAVLSRAFGMHYRSSVNLDKRVSGTYAGSLSRVVTRILEGYNFVLETDNGSIAVTVHGTPDAAGAVPGSSTPKVGAQPPRGVEDLARPAASAATTAPSPAIDLAQGRSFPTPAVPTSGAAPAPVPELRQSEALAPAPPAMGSTATPVPEPGPSTGTPPSLAGPTPLSAPPRAQ
jgi:hypothetical protein